MSVSKEEEELIAYVIYHFMIPSFVVIGLVLSFLSFKILLTDKPRSTITIYLLGLTVADVWTLLNGLLHSILEFLRKENSPSTRNLIIRFISVYLPYFDPLSGLITNFLTMLISVERLLAVTAPLMARRFSQKKTSNALVVFAFVFSGILVIPYAFVYTTKDTLFNGTNASLTIVDESERQEYFKTVSVVIHCVGIVLPVSVVTVSSAVSVCKLLRNVRCRQMLVLYSHSPNTSTELQVTRVLLMITSVFAICKLPGMVFRIIVIADPENSLHRFKNSTFRIGFLVTYVLLIFNSCVNFPIYITASTHYRALLTRVCSCRRSRSSSTGRNDNEQNARNIDLVLPSTISESAT